MDKLFTLLALQRQAQEAETLNALSHVITNETLKLIPYKQAVFWSANGLNIKLKSVSGNATLDDKSSYAINLKSFIKNQTFKPNPEEDRKADYAESYIPEAFPDEKNWMKNPACLVLFKTNKDGYLGGLWLEREEPFKASELQILSELAVSYAHALATTILRDHGFKKLLFSKLKKLRLFFVLAALLILLFPVRISVTAPAEIIAQKPFIISAPFDATLEEIVVDPGDKVAEGQIVAQMDKINLQSQLDTVAQELEVARANLSRLRRESLSSPEKKIELKRIEAEIAAKTIEFDYAQSIFERSDVKSPVKGIAIFADKNALTGKPVRLGENIMMVADPEKSELLVRVPVDAMIPIEDTASVKFFLNVAPLKGHKANITSIGYQASPDPDGLLSYKIHADLHENTKDLRIGWKGTAKIYGQRTVLGYALLRRPLVTLREFFGV